MAMAMVRLAVVSRAIASGLACPRFRVARRSEMIYLF
jgi:hypothetical protein